MSRYLSALLLLLPLSAQADRRELYVELAAGPALLELDDPAGGSVQAQRPGALGTLLAYYGLSNTLHVGGFVQGTFGRDFAFSGVAVQQPDGSAPQGTLYQNSFSFGAGPLVLYRMDTGYNLAPVAHVEVGFAYSSYRRLQLVPEGRSFAIDLPNLSDFSVSARGVVGLEYRMADSWVATVGFGIRRSFNSLNAWSFDVPLSLGFIF